MPASAKGEQIIEGQASPMNAQGHGKLDVRLPGKGNLNFHGARPVHLTIAMIKWIRSSRLSLKNSLSLLKSPLKCPALHDPAVSPAEPYNRKYRRDIEGPYSRLYSTLQYPDKRSPNSTKIGQRRPAASIAEQRETGRRSP